MGLARIDPPHIGREDGSDAALQPEGRALEGNGSAPRRLDDSCRDVAISATKKKKLV